MTTGSDVAAAGAQDRDAQLFLFLEALALLAVFRAVVTELDLENRRSLEADYQPLVELLSEPLGAGVPDSERFGRLAWFSNALALDSVQRVSLGEAELGVPFPLRHCSNRANYRIDSANLSIQTRNPIKTYRSQ